MAFLTGPVGNPRITATPAFRPQVQVESRPEPPSDALVWRREASGGLELIPNLLSTKTTTGGELGEELRLSPQFPSQKYVIFGKGQSEIPPAVADLVKLPEPVPAKIASQRWVVTPQIEAKHQQQVDTGEFLGDNRELRSFIGPLVAQRYADRQHLTVVELGPATSTVVAESLQNHADRYLSVEMSEPYAKEQLRRLDLFTVDGYAVKGDTYNLPLQEKSSDVIVTSCHPPFFSASLEDKKIALDQVYQALKEGGEFVLFPFIDSKQPQEFKNYIQERFSLVESHAPQGQPERQALILKKKSPN